MVETRGRFSDIGTTQNKTIHSSYFFDFHDQEFVEEAYRKLLLRDADPAGLEQYLRAVRNGESRYRVLRDISRSAEARKSGVKLIGMSVYEVSRLVKAIPIIGTIIELVSFVCRIKSFRRDIRALENHIYRVYYLNQRR